jgi:hypothetical protein
MSVRRDQGRFSSFSFSLRVDSCLSCLNLESFRSFKRDPKTFSSVEVADPDLGLVLDRRMVLATPFEVLKRPIFFR